MAVVVVYGGGFQPFHAGHLSGYIEAKQAFPDADFYVAASNDTKTRPIPFKDKKFLAQQAGVTDNFVEVKLPIRPTEILDRYNPNKDVFILVRSERDPVAYTKKDGSPGYYQPYVDINKCEPMGQHGYVFVTHKKDFKLNGQTVYSGTQVRDMYAKSDDRGRINIINQLYPQSTQQDTIKKMLDKYIGTIAEPVEKPVKGAIKKLKKDKLKEYIQLMRPLLREANNEQKLKLLKLMKIALKEQGLLRGVAEGSLNEFALPGSNDGGDDGFNEETLKRLAAQWYNGDEDPRVERTLMAAGWEIGQDEGYDDEPGVFVVQSGDVNGNSYISWPAHELKQGVAEGSGNWYVRVKGKVLKDKQFNAIPFSSKETATQQAFEIHRKKRIPLDMIKLTQSWMDGPETQSMAESNDYLEEK